MLILGIYKEILLEKKNTNKNESDEKNKNKSGKILLQKLKKKEKFDSKSVVTKSLH